jgi:hypothetical protein
VRKQWSTIAGVAVVVAVLVVVALAAVVARTRMQAAENQQCRERVRDDSRRVNTERWYSPEELIDLGIYQEIHWQTRTEGECDQGATMVNYLYQGVVKLRPEDARTLAKRITDVAQNGWLSFPSPSSPPPSSPSPTGTAQASTGTAVGGVPLVIWTDLLVFVPAGVKWVHSPAYDAAQVPSRKRSLFVDPDLAVAFFSFSDS